MIAENLLMHIKNVHKRSYIARLIILTIIFAILTLVFFTDIQGLTRPVEYKDFNSMYTISKSAPPYYYEILADFNNIYTFDTAYIDEDDNVLQYYVALLNDEGDFVLAEVPAELYNDVNITQYTGHFVAVEDELRAMIIEDLKALDFTEQEAIDMAPTQLFKVEDNRFVAWIFVGILFLGLLSILYAIVKLIGIFNNSNSSALYKQAALAGDVDKIYMDLERAPVNLQHPNFGVAGSNYILINKSKINIIPTKDVIWAYEHVYKKKVYFIITVSKIHSLMLVTKDKKYQVILNAKVIPTALETVHRVTPWVVFGYTKETEQMYKTNRDYFINEVNRSSNEMHMDDQY
ncbi:DUF6709 family protein [Fusibacter bizertensis]